MADSRRYAWFVVGLLWFVALLNYLDRLILTSMRPSILADIPMSEGQFGLLSTVFLWVYGATSPLGGFLADRYSRRGVILSSLLIWSALTLATGFADSIGAMLTARALMGVSEAFYIPTALAMIAEFHPGRTRGLAIGIHMTGIYCGTALGGVGGYIADYASWQCAFISFGGIGVAYAAFLFFFLRDPAPQSSPAPGDETPLSEVRVGEAFRALLSNVSFLCLLLYWSLLSIAGWVIVAWLPTFLMERFQLTQGQSGMMATLYIGFASLLGVVGGGIASDRWAQRNPRARLYLPAAGCYLMGPILILVAMTVSPAVAIAGLVAYGLVRGSCDCNAMPTLCQITRREYRATGYGILNCIATFAGGAMVWVGGIVRDRGINLQIVFLLAAAAPVLAASALLFVRPRREA